MRERNKAKDVKYLRYEEKETTGWGNLLILLWFLSRRPCRRLITFNLNLLLFFQFLG